MKTSSAHLELRRVFPAMRSTASKFLALSLAVPAAALSLSLGAQEASELEEVVITGVRGKPRTVQDSPVPVDVFSQDDLENVEFTDMNDIIRTLVPTYNLTRQPISDGGTFIRSATMRGLPTDKTLVLVNGKRRHRAALVTIGGAGTQGPDLATIPASAIGGLEILRDGAAALYGSDAIAGVMNFQLKNNDSGGSLSVTTGEYYESDGANTTISGNIGFSVGDGGFLSISAETYQADPTYRGNQYCGSWFCLDPNGAAWDAFQSSSRLSYLSDETFMAGVPNASLDGPVVQPWGNPNVERTSLFFNMGMPMSDSVDFYAFGNYTESESDGGFFYRFPGNGVVEDLREPDGTIYTPLEKFPGGFTPRFYGDVEDISLVAGLSSSGDDKLGWDVSVRTGESSIDYTLANTINPSMGPDSPTVFSPGSLTNTETQLQLDLTYALSDTVTVLGGLSYLDEEYDIGQGEPDSYVKGEYSFSDPWDLCNVDMTPTDAGQAAMDAGTGLDCASEDDPVYTRVPFGSNGFPGYPAEFSGVYSRNSFATYGEVNADVTDNLFVQAALRYEDYEDFGSETIYKIAGNLKVSDNLSLRASVNTGFRAPTPGQQGTVNISTRLPNGVPVARGLFPASSAVARSLGAEDLKPETSFGFSAGITGTVGIADFTIDYYSIDVDDYFNAVSPLPVSEDGSEEAMANYNAIAAAADQATADAVQEVNYFQNGYDVSVSGIDAVITTSIDSDMGSTDLTLTAGFNEFEFNGPATGLNAQDTYDAVNFNPHARLILQPNHRMDNIAINARGSYWGEASNRRTSSEDSPIQDFGSVFMADLSVSYMGDSYTITAGGMNIFDEYPDKDGISDYCCGRIYPSASTISWQGGRWYLKAEYLF